MGTGRIGIGLTLALVAASPAPSAFAQSDEQTRPALVKRLSDCRRLEAAARLSCYDDAVDAFERAEAKGEIVVVDRERADKVRRQAFGFSLPSLSILERPARAAGETPERLDHLTATLASARQRGDGKWVLELEDGAVWVQSDTLPLRKGAQKGMQVEIRGASMGGYFVKIDNQRAIRATRLK